MDLSTLFIVLSIVLSISSYNIKINPVVKTSVQNIKNSGDHNTIQLSSITNSTILQAAVPHQIYQSHLNELYSTSAILVIFSVLFIILSIILTRVTVIIFKSNQRLNHLEVIIQWLLVFAEYHWKSKISLFLTI